MGEAGPGVSAGPLVGGDGSQGLWLQGPGGSGASESTLLCGDRSCDLWWTGPSPGVVVSSGRLKAADLLVDGVVSPAC